MWCSSMIIALFAVISYAQNPTPVVLWHGLGGYHDSDYMNRLSDLIKANTSSGMYVHSLVIGGGKWIV